MTLVDVVDLHTTFRREAEEYRAVRGVSLSVDAGETLVVVGESGSGKTVVTRSILRLLPKSATTRGSVMFDGVDLATLPESEVRRYRGPSIGLIPQDPVGSLDPLRTIGAQIAEVVRVHDRSVSKAQARDRVRDLLAEVGVSDTARVAGSRPHELSGGLCQRAAIAMAVAPGPRLLIADEPTTALDATIQAAVLDLILGLQSRDRMALIFITHDVGVAEVLGGSTAVMYAGRIVETGPTREVLASPVHPYTRVLTESVPRPGVARGQIPTIGGTPPVLSAVPPGCAFSSRCPMAQARCGEGAPPELVAVDEPTRQEPPEHAHACLVVQDLASTTSGGAR